MHKLIIVEGVDRVGKNTFINGVIKLLAPSNFCYRHFGKPPVKDNFDLPLIGHNGLARQMSAFRHEFDIAKLLLDPSNRFYGDNLLIWNRSHLGEYVYGPLYRKEEPSLIQAYIRLLEENMTTMLSRMYLVLLQGDPEVLCNNDDGKSLMSTSGLNNTTLIEREQNAFRSIVNYSIIPHKMILDVTADGAFRDPKSILEDAKAFLS